MTEEERLVYKLKNKPKDEKLHTLITYTTADHVGCNEKFRGIFKT